MTSITSLLNNFAVAVGDKCNPRDGGSFFDFPTWHKYLPGIRERDLTCAPKLSELNDVWLIALAVTDILLRLAILVAIAFVLIGGFKYITSQANPEKTARAKNTIVDGLVGVLIAIIAVAAVSFIAGRFTG